jgi:hypothetical protein
VSEIVFESAIGDPKDGLLIFVQIHPDYPTAPLLTIQRHGINEKCFNSGTELRLVGEAIRLAGLKLMEEGQ